MAYDTPTREQLAQEYAKALVIINNLRTQNAALLDALKAVELAAQTDADTCAICHQDLLRHASGCAILTAQGVIAEAQAVA